MLNSIKAEREFEKAGGNYHSTMEINHEMRQGQAIRPFQDLFSKYFAYAVKQNIECSIDLSSYGSNRASLGLVSEGSWDIYLFKKVFTLPSHGNADAVIFVDKQNKSKTSNNNPYLVFYGESMKGWLDRGVGGYLLPADAKEFLAGEAEITQVINEMLSPCLKYFDNLERQPKADGSGTLSSYDVAKEITQKITPLTAQQFVKLATKYKLAAHLGRGMNERISFAKEIAASQKEINKTPDLEKFFGKDCAPEFIDRTGDKTLYLSAKSGSAAQELLSRGIIKPYIEYSHPATPYIRFSLYDNGGVSIRAQNEQTLAAFKNLLCPQP